MIYLLFLLLTLIGNHLIFRGILPLIWTLNAIVSDNKYTYVLLLHFIYLFILIIFDIILLKNLIKQSRFAKYKNNIFDQKRVHAIILFFGWAFLILFLILKPFPLPIFYERGSDAIVEISLQYNKYVWFYFGIMFAINLLASFIFFQSKKYSIKVISFMLILLTSIIAGKKSGLLQVIANFTLLYLIFEGREPRLFRMRKNGFFIHKKMAFISLLISAFLIIAIYFALIQFKRTVGDNYITINIFNLMPNFAILVFSSSTAYLVQFITLEGIEYYKDYSESLGTLGIVKYFLNPVFKFLFNIGIDKAIGPYLYYKLFGSDFPHGVNPTLFFEFIFITGNIEVGFILSIISIVFIFKISQLCIKYLKDNKYNNPFILSFVYGVLVFLLSFTADTLNTIRNIPFLLMVLLFEKIYFWKIHLRKILRNNNFKKQVITQNI
jgi:hypothetical protein